MNERNASIAATRQLTWPLHAARVLVVLAACYVAAAPLILWVQGPFGLAVAAMAALVCGLASVGAVATASIFGSAGQPLAATLVAMCLRMAVPLAFCITLAVRGGPLVDAGIVLYVLGFYMIVLAVDTWLSTRHVPDRPGRERAIANGQ